jgi:radical SAM protein with 4Fe4S-binding SPASM domain
MEVLDYSDFLRRLDRRAAGSRIPVSGTIEVSRRCPLRCVHCYNNLPMGDAVARRGELTTAEHCLLLDEITDAGCLWLLYTGGEVFARRDFLDIYTHAKRRGLLITLFTNGTLITPTVADHLVRYPPQSIEVTLYGSTPTTYDRVTGVPGSYERCRRGIGLLLERGLPLRLKTMGMTINRHEIWEMKRFAEGLGVNFTFDAMINPRIDCSQGPLAVRLAPEQVIALDLQDPRRMAEWRRLADGSGGGGTPPEPCDELYDCGAGIHSFAIDPEGMMSLCVVSHRDSYDLRTGSFREGWERFLLQVRRRKSTRPTKCASCSLRQMCAMCPANGELEKGDPEPPVDFLCQTSHLRAYVLGLVPQPHGECEYCEGGAGYEALAVAAADLRSNATGSPNS